MHAVIKINYAWENPKDINTLIKPKHREVLHKTALEQIANDINKGRTNGRLTDKVKLTKEDGDGIEYNGWWDSKLIKKVGL